VYAEDVLERWQNVLHGEQYTTHRRSCPFLLRAALLFTEKQDGVSATMIALWKAIPSIHGGGDNASGSIVRAYSIEKSRRTISDVCSASVVASGEDTEAALANSFPESHPVSAARLTAITRAIGSREEDCAQGGA